MPLNKGIQKDGWAYPVFPFGFGVTAKTATGTLSPGECGIIAVTGGAAVTLTLPDPTERKGLWYLILNQAGQNLIVAAPTVDTLITFNDLAADSVEFSTGGNLIGAAVLLVSNGTNWVAINVGTHTMTVNT